MKKRAWIVAGAAAAALAVPFGWWQNNGLTVRRYEYRSPKVGAALDGATVVQISDLHNHRFGEGQGRLLAAVAELEPDLVVITGDMVDCHRTDPAPALELVRGLVALAPVYYVTGNHEWVLSSQVRGELLTGLEEAGATVLEDRVTRVALGEGYLTLAGLSDGSLKGDALERLAADFPRGELTLLLAHEPQHLERYAATGADLVFSGHAHGGQVRLPLVGGLYAPGQGVLPELTEGLHTAGGTTLVVSRGLGNSTFPLRLFNRPEVVAVTLRTEGGSDTGAARQGCRALRRRKLHILRFRLAAKAPSFRSSSSPRRIRGFRRWASAGASLRPTGVHFSWRATTRRAHNDRRVRDAAP